MITEQQWLKKYNVNGPRYTSYPTALEFNQSITDNFQLAAAQGSENHNLSLYFHIPFCFELCFYCGCNKIVSRHQDKSIRYVEMMLKELRARSVGLRNKPVNQIHFGGGTPNFLTNEQFQQIFKAINDDFTIEDSAEISVELDVRHVSFSLLTTLRDCGVNRLSFGLQDTNEEVQKAINRQQSNELVYKVLEWTKQLGFESINVDLIYGLPHQSITIFEQTLRDVIAFNPDRISLFSYAHLPSRFASQRKIKDEWLPTPTQKFELMLLANKVLCEQAGYVAIGFDHFAKPSDRLVSAQELGELHRNFQGYTLLADSDLLAIGASAISYIGNVYMQNPKKISDYYDIYDTQHITTAFISSLEQPTEYKNHLPKLPGRILTHDDLVRADIIKHLMCNFLIKFEYVENKWGVDFLSYFSKELLSLVPFEEDGMIRCSDNEIVINPKARLFVRNICMTFDRYLASQLNQKRYSQVI